MQSEPEPDAGQLERVFKPGLAQNQHAARQPARVQIKHLLQLRQRGIQRGNQKASADRSVFISTTRPGR